MSGSQQLLLGTGAGGAAPVYIEDVFQTWLYTGNNSAQTVTNGIDLSTKGGLVWIKSRSGTADNFLTDTSRGTGQVLYSNSTLANQNYGSSGLSAFNVNGFSLNGFGAEYNTNLATYVSWTFRKQPKFFDIVTYTGDGSGLGQFINHSLGSAPGFIVVKRTSDTSNWVTWHRGVPGAVTGKLNLTVAFDNTGWVEGNAGSPSTRFLVAGTTSADPDHMNVLGQSYVAYLFAHNAGGFGLTGTDNVISCGSYTGNGGSLSVNLGYEAQWVLIKRADASGSWLIVDNMRAMSETSTLYLYPTYSFSEQDPGTSVVKATSTGFGLPTNSVYNANGSTYVYVAIRRGPMKTPTSGTSVFVPTLTSASTGTAVTTNIVTDMHWANFLAGDGQNTTVFDRLRGITSTSSYNPNLKLVTSSVDAESNIQGPAGYAYSFGNTGWVQGFYASGASSIRYDFRRAPGFFDVVCYTGDGATGGTRQFSHNLTVAPELMILKRRNSTSTWYVYGLPILSVNATGVMALELTDPSTSFNGQNIFGDGTNIVQPTASVFTIRTNAVTNTNNGTYVWYGFASVAGVSKVGGYTGTGALQTINCGFTGGARFVLIKRIDAAGDWWVYDSARGISSGNDPYLFLNSTAAQVTGTNYVDTTSVGFQVTAAAPAGLNANGGSYIFLAIA